MKTLFGPVEVPNPRWRRCSCRSVGSRHDTGLRTQHVSGEGCNLINTWTGRQLHGFGWLTDDLIGKLPPEWNWLEGHSSMELNPKAVHFTRGTPDMPGYENVPYADEWRAINAQFGSSETAVAQ